MRLAHSEETAVTRKKILTDDLTNKQRILRMVERWDDDIPFEKALYHLHFMKEVMEAIEEAEQGVPALITIHSLTN